MTTKCSQLKMLAPDGKIRLRDTLDTKGIFRLIESAPSPKAEPFKLWLAQLGSDRIDEVFDPEKPIGLSENRKVAKRGGKVAKRTKDFFEEETGSNIISKESNLNYKYVNENMLIEKE